MSTATTRRPTLEQVAAAAQVPASPVSKVLNGRPSISPETRRRVEVAIERLGYCVDHGPAAPVQDAFLQQGEERLHGGVVSRLTG